MNHSCAPQMHAACYPMPQIIDLTWALFIDLCNIQKEYPCSYVTDMDPATNMPCLQFNALDNKQVEAYFEKECQMQAQDKLQEETSERKNALEGYILGLRNK